MHHTKEVSFNSIKDVNSAQNTKEVFKSSLRRLPYTTY